MVCLGLEPGAAGWKTQTNPLSYGGTPTLNKLLIYINIVSHGNLLIGVKVINVTDLFMGQSRPLFLNFRLFNES